MPQWLTRWESLSCAYPKWPASNRNAGRLRFGTMAGFASEYPAGLNRNPQVEQIDHKGAIRAPY
jgi:hypothetical protein